MEYNERLVRPIRETRYLSAENCARYRPILRIFYQEYQHLNYWLSRQEVFDRFPLEAGFTDYTTELLQHDLDALVEWGNLEHVQDTSRASTVQAFLNRQFRYRLTVYSVEIERMVVRLENLSSEGASLEPTLLERIQAAVGRLPALLEQPDEEVHAWWKDLEHDFRRLNQNYQDYIKAFHGARADELMRSQAFILHKDKLVSYMRSFIKGLQRSGDAVRTRLLSLSDEDDKRLVQAILNWETGIPRLEGETDADEITRSLNGRWLSFRRWFTGSGTSDSELVRVLGMTNDIIRRITRYAARIAESHSGSANRREEYLHLAKLFLRQPSVEEAHRLSPLVFGLFRTRHVKGIPDRQTESTAIGAYEEEPFELTIKPRVRQYKEKMRRKPMRERGAQRGRIRGEWLEKLAAERAEMESWMTDRRLDFGMLPVLRAASRAMLLKWLGDALAAPDRIARTEDGRTVRVEAPADGERCILRCEDGNLEMPRFSLVFQPNDGEEGA